MDLRSAIIIKNTAIAASTISTRKVRNLIDYLTRRGDFAYEGCDTHITDDDRALAKRSDVEGLADYAARTGRFAYRLRNDDPLTEGEVSGGLWGRDGVINPNAFKQAMRESKSHVMHSIISVKREDATELGLATKEAWQKSLRATWDSYAQSWGVIFPDDIEWAAAYHVDHAKNLHVHILTIDITGAWATRSPRIEHKDFVWGFYTVREELYRPYITREEREASEIRNWMCARMRAICGAHDTERELAVQKRLEAVTSLPLPPPGPCLPDKSKTQSAIREYRSSLPQGDERTLSYNRSNDTMRKAARRMAERIKDADPYLTLAYERYETIARDKAAAYGHMGIDAKDGYPVNLEARAVNKTMYDLNVRLANAALTELRRSSHGRTTPPRTYHARPERYPREEALHAARITHVLASAAYEFAHALESASFPETSHVKTHNSLRRLRERNTHTAISKERMMER